MEETWRYDLSHPDTGEAWETGFESEDDAHEAMAEAMAEMIEEVASKHPELSDEEIEQQISWEVRPD